MIWILIPLIIIIFSLIILFFTKVKNRIIKFSILGIILLIIVIFIIKLIIFNSYDIKVYKNTIPVLTTAEEQKEIESYYKKTDLNKNIPIDLAIIGNYRISFNDGNTVYMDNNNDNYARLVKDNDDTYIIVKLPEGFKEYILNLH